MFYGTGFFPVYVYRSLRDNKSYSKIGSDSEEFVVLGLPDEVRLTRRQIPDQLKGDDDDDGNNNPMAEIFRKILESESMSCGVIVNSFYEMEPAYATYYKEIIGAKAWHIGPVSLFNRIDDDKESSPNDCLSWPNSKKPNSVLYVCFGTMAFLQTPQLHEIAKGLQHSGREVIWVVRENAKLDEEFETRIEGRGLIIRGWAPQVKILDHEAVGGFITHCGWNSLLEGVAAGVPMITWSLSAEQFFNEKLATEILKIGIPVGAREWTKRTDEREIIKGENIERAVAQLMGGEEEAERMRIRARELGDLATRAVEEGGSSAIDLKSLMEELRMYRRS